jgi:hypothetical protein
MRKLAFSILAGAAVLAMSSSASAQTVTQGQGPNFATHITASTSNDQNNNVQVYGSTTGVGGADVLFTGNTPITITDGNGFASIGDAAGGTTFTALIIDPAPFFNALQFNLSLDAGAFLQVDYSLGGGVFAAATPGTISQNGNANTGYTITAAAGTVFDAIRLTSCATAARCNLVTTGVGVGTGPNINFERQNSINVASVTGAVPEPGTWAMMLIGFGGMGVAMRRRRRTGAQLAQVA